MRILCDTNVLSRSIDPSQPLFQEVTGALQQVRQKGFLTTVVSQNLYELWVVLTRPVTSNGLGKSHSEAIAILQTIKTLFMILDDVPLVRLEWEKLVDQYRVQGKNAHDARLVAAMKVHQIKHLLTLNIQDFTRFGGITIFTPAQVLAMP